MMYKCMVILCLSTISVGILNMANNIETLSCRLDVNPITHDLLK